MADQRRQNLQTATWPAPPPFYRAFTKSNISALNPSRREGGAGVESEQQDARRSPIHNPRRGHTHLPANIDVLALPSELRLLVPPTPPIDDRYRSFGQTIDLHAASTSPLNPGIHVDHSALDDISADGQASKAQEHLLALARSLLLTFLNLMGTLSQDPAQWELRGGGQDLRGLVASMHGWINAYRPHQARETVVLLMRERVERLRKEVALVEEGREGLRRLCEGMKETHDLADVAQSDGVASKVIARPQEGGRRNARERARQRAAWAALHRAM